MQKLLRNQLIKHLSAFLLAYRNSSHSTAASSPTTLLLGTQLRARLDLVRPSTESLVLNEQSHQMLSRRGRATKFVEGEKVLVRDYRPNADKWLEATIKDRTGPVSYIVEDKKMKNELRRHCDQIIRCHETETTTELGTALDEKAEVPTSSKIKRQSKKPHV